MAKSLSSPRSKQLQNTSHPLFRNGDVTPAPSNWGSVAYNAARCWEHRVSPLLGTQGKLLKGMEGRPEAGPDKASILR